ncbi:hypothetical protein ACIPJS_05380 [Streptomyces sp. NPDC086783]|uniref:hypothetical protein n=1 Tax=Streptomyces sp. NPDC086783 TaxID=3365758 RepID=UPI0038225A34
MVRRRRTKKRPAFGIPSEVILLRGREGWPYAFGAHDARGGCGKAPMAADSAPEDVRAAVSAQLADLIRTLHGVEIDVVWSPLTSDSWVGRITPSDGT